MFVEACAVLADAGVARASTVYAGDDLMDLRAARGTGLGCVGVATGGTTDERFASEGADRVADRRGLRSGGRCGMRDTGLRTGPDGEYWHETAGVFVRRASGTFLLFRRVRFPFGLTLPAGHVGVAEPALDAARRELAEETGLESRTLEPFGDIDIVGDSCRRGSDAHRWHVFGTDVAETARVSINHEGTDPVWLTVAEADQCDGLTYATALAVQRFRALVH